MAQYAVGDVRAGSMKRVASASGEGAAVVPLVHAHLDGQAARAPAAAGQAEDVTVLEEARA